MYLYIFISEQLFVARTVYIKLQMGGLLQAHIIYGKPHWKVNSNVEDTGTSFTHTLAENPDHGKPVLPPLVHQNIILKLKARVRYFN
jgi:hypothetical protein